MFLPRTEAVRQKLKNKKNLSYLLLFTAINNCVLGSNLNTVTGVWSWFITWPAGIAAEENNTFLKKHIIIIFFLKKLFTYLSRLKQYFSNDPLFFNMNLFLISDL